MFFYPFDKVKLKDGFIKEKYELNRKITINAVYDRFCDTGRISAFECKSVSDNHKQPHFFWDSDVAKWIEGAAYLIKLNPDKELEQKIDRIVELIHQNQLPDGYFNSYFMTVEPSNRFKDRDKHELYCAGHLIEAAIAYAEATGKTKFLHCMEKYADCIIKIFTEEKSAAFTTPGHEEIEIALVRLYRYTGKKKYLDLAAFFINERGTHENEITDYCQSHAPVREQHTAVGHAVRAVYLYSAMADLAYELKDKKLESACEALYNDIVRKKMYITGGIGSCHIGETFTQAYDLPNETAYAETCAGIGLMFFAARMLRLHNNADYADTIERVFYNNVLSGLSLDGKAFFYENPLEITRLNRFSGKRYPITKRQECFECSCCPPNLNRLLASIGGYIFGFDNDTLYINQFTACSLDADTVKCEMITDYPHSGKISIKAAGVGKIAIRIPSSCAGFKINKSYTTENGYAIVANDEEIIVEFDISPYAVVSDSKVIENIGKLCIQSGPIVYCAESVDNIENLHEISISPKFNYRRKFDSKIGLDTLVISAYRRVVPSDRLYTNATDGKAECTHVKLNLIPYNSFANRGESDMLVWFNSI